MVPSLHLGRKALGLGSTLIPESTLLQSTNLILWKTASSKMAYQRGYSKCPSCQKSYTKLPCKPHESLFYSPFYFLKRANLYYLSLPPILFIRFRGTRDSWLFMKIKSTLKGQDRPTFWCSGYALGSEGSSKTLGYHSSNFNNSGIINTHLQMTFLKEKIP